MAAADTLIARLQADCTAAGWIDGGMAELVEGGRPLLDWLRDVEADAKADPLLLNRGSVFDRKSRHLRIDEVAR